MDIITVDLGQFFFTDPEAADDMYGAMQMCLPPYLTRWLPSSEFIDLLSGETNDYKRGDLHVIPAGLAYLWHEAYIVPIFEALYSKEYGVLLAPCTWNIYPCVEAERMYLKQLSEDEHHKRAAIRATPVQKPMKPKRRPAPVYNLADYQQGTSTPKTEK